MFVKRKSVNIILEHPVDFLKYSDEVILNSYSELFNISTNSKLVIKNLLNRKLWHRGMIVSEFNIENDELDRNYVNLEVDLHLKTEQQYLIDIKDKIINEVRKIDPSAKIEHRDIWIDVPKPPSDKEAKELKIKRSHTSNENPLPLLDVFPLADWIEAYKAFKLRSHIFCWKEHQKIIYSACKNVLLDTFNLKVLDFTSNLCKIDI